MRLIDADRFKDNIMSGLYVFCQENKEDIARAIDAEPTVERPQGEWITHHIPQFFNLSQSCNPIISCSLCGNVVKFSGNYCPNCGAWMKKGGNKNE